MATQIAPARAQTQAGNPRGNWLMLAVLLTGQLMCILDVFVVNVAMPSIGAELHASGASLQLIVGGYTIGYATLLITGARLGDRYGRRRMYLTGLGVFTLASLACALAPDSLALIAFRFVQGTGAAVLVPQIFSIIQLRFTGQARARALSAYAAVLSTGAVAGLVLGGVIVTANLFGLGWRPVFAINVPIGVLLAVAVPRTLPADEHTDGTARLDLAGLAIGAAAVLLLVVPLVLGQETGWPAWTYGSLAAGVAASVVFVRAERRVAAGGGHPLVNLDVLRSPGLPSGLTALVLSQVAYGGLLFTCTLYLQAGLGESALRAAATYVPFSATFGVIGYCWRRLPARTYRALVPAGLALSGLGYLALATGQPVAAALAVVGAGLGLAVSPLLIQSLARVRPERAADASGLLTTSVQLGQLTGVAALGSVYLALLHPTAHAHAYAQAHDAMSATAYGLAALSACGALVAARLSSPALPGWRSST
jgi:MFS family permease